MGNAQGKQAGKSSQRDKALVPHGHTARFLYLMLKQIDTRQIDWQKVADGTGITSAISARNRYARFRKSVESRIDGDTIQAKREQKEGYDTSDYSQVRDSARFNTSPTTPLRTASAGADVRRRIKTEPGTMLHNHQEPRQDPRSHMNDNDDEIMTDAPSASSSYHTPGIKREQGLYNDFSDCLIKREKEVDDDIFSSSSFRVLSSHYDDALSVNTYGQMPQQPALPAQPSSTLSPSPVNPSRRPDVTLPTRRHIISSPSSSLSSLHRSTIPQCGYRSTSSSLFNTSSPRRPNVTSPSAPQRMASRQNSWDTLQSTPELPFHIPQENRAQSSNATKSNSGQFGTGSAEEPFSLDD